MKVCNGTNKKIEEALVKKATGYTVDEEVEEYSYQEAEEKLIKKKVTKKHVPADLGAIKLLMERRQGDREDLEAMSDEDIEKLRVRYIKELL